MSYVVAVGPDGEFKRLQIPHDKKKFPTVTSLGKHDTF
jgi:hypothetical protein